MHYLHGNLLIWRQEGILLLGKAKSGKTLLSWLLLQRGAQLISDDLVGIFLFNDRYYGLDPGLAYRQHLCLHGQIQMLPQTYCAYITKIDHIYQLDSGLMTSGNSLCSFL
jgi:serine kinase of HPr protein (carbohydrate metabolism regulator)